MEQLLTAKQLAKAIGVNPETIRRWTRDKKITVHQVGNTKRYRLSEIVKPTEQE